MNDHSMFINFSKRSLTTILVHVDDIILAGNDQEKIDRIKQALNKTFKIKDLGDLRYFLGLEVARSDKRIMMNQMKYALELIKDVSLLTCKPTITHIDNLVKLSFTGSVSFTYVHAYRRMIGRLMYLTNIRFHYNVATRILRYIKGARSPGLFFSSSSFAHLKAFCDTN